MTKVAEKNYSESQEAEMLAAGIIDNAKALEFAARFGKDVRSIRAKAVRMGIYKAAEKVSKTGGKIESKEASLLPKQDPKPKGGEKSPPFFFVFCEFFLLTRARPPCYNGATAPKFGPLAPKL